MKYAHAAFLALIFMPGFAFHNAMGQEDETLGLVDIGETGWHIKRPVFAAACPFACPWGEIGEFVRDAMAPLGYDVILCRNCNIDRGPRLVATGALPPPLTEREYADGAVLRLNAAPVFGVTASHFLAAAHHGPDGFGGGTYDNLRAITKIEDPAFLLVAVRSETGITDLSQIRENKIGLRVLAGDGADDVLAHYGLTREMIENWGGSFGVSMGSREDAEFDLMIDDFGTPFFNPESSHWPLLSVTRELRFLELPEDLIEALAQSPKYEIVSTKWGMLPGMESNLRTVGRSGEVIFTRADAPEDAIYDVAKAIDEARRDLMWLARRYHIEPRTIGDGAGVPLHPGAARYYREMGYIE